MKVFYEVGQDMDKSHCLMHFFFRLRYVLAALPWSYVQARSKTLKKCAKKQKRGGEYWVVDMRVVRTESTGVVSKVAGMNEDFEVWNETVA